MYSEERMLVWRFIFFCNERTLFAERPLMLDTAIQMINDFDEAEHARRTLKPTVPPEADKPE